MELRNIGFRTALLIALIAVLPKGRHATKLASNWASETGFPINLKQSLLSRPNKRFHQ
jgi:hypothetical protein